jgi:hypothetical protein
MSLLVAWLAFPLLTAGLAIGAGLALERLAGRTLPTVLVAPMGLATLVVVAGLATASDQTAELATPSVVALAVAGFVLAPPWVRRIDPWALAASITVFGVFAAPVLLSGEATFAGYVKLDDTATWLALVDRVMSHGPSLDGLAPSSYEATLASYLGNGAPYGSLLPIGVGHELTGVDSAWLFQPSLAIFAAALGSCLYALLEPAIASQPLRALAVVLAATPALLYGYALWGAVKELAAAFLLALLAAVAAWILRRPAGLPGWIPFAVVSAAMIGVLTPGGVLWIAPVALGLIALVWVRDGRRVALRGGLVAATLTAALSVPGLMYLGRFVAHTSGNDVLTRQAELGNLIRPLESLQLAGIWPAEDFRLDPARPDATYTLIAIVLAVALIGLWWALRQRMTGLLLYAAGAVTGLAVVTPFGSPWVDAKALATASPLVLVFALVGVAGLARNGRRVEAVFPLTAVIVGVFWSTALANQGASLAPRAQLRELETIGRTFAGDGPALMTEYQPYGVRHFLRFLDPEGASELRRRRIPLRDGSLLPKGAAVTVAKLEPAAVAVYRTLVLRPALTAGVPPAYERVWRGRYYEVWQRLA